MCTEIMNYELKCALLQLVLALSDGSSPLSSPCSLGYSESVHHTAQNIISTCVHVTLQYTSLWWNIDLQIIDYYEDSPQPCPLTSLHGVKVLPPIHIPQVNVPSNKETAWA